MDGDSRAGHLRHGAERDVDNRHVDDTFCAHLLTSMITRALLNEIPDSVFPLNMDNLTILSSDW